MYGLIAYFVAKYVVEPSPVGGIVAGLLAPIGGIVSNLVGGLGMGGAA